MRKSSGNGKRAEHSIPDSLTTPSSGSIFEDVGFAPHEARNLELRAELMNQIEAVIRMRKLTQQRAAKLFGVTQPRISDLLRDKIDRFSIDTLIAMLHRAGIQVRLSLRPGKAA